MGYNKNDDSGQYNKSERGGWYCTNPKKHDEASAHHASGKPHEHKAERNDSQPKRGKWEPLSTTPPKKQAPVIETPTPNPSNKKKNPSSNNGCGCAIFILIIAGLFKWCSDMMETDYTNTPEQNDYTEQDYETDADEPIEIDLSEYDDETTVPDSLHDGASISKEAQ